MAISYKDLIAELGKTVESSEIKALFKKLGTDKLPKLVKEQGEYETSVYHALPKLGLNLIFELPEDADPIKSNEKLLTLTGIQIFSKSPANGITHDFAGEMPYGIEFSDTQKEVQKKAGKPTKSKKEFRLDMWDKVKPKFSVEYKKDHSVEMVAYEIEI